MLRSFHAELQKAHRRHDLLLCLLVPLIMILWVGGLAPSDSEELANGYSALLYSCLLYTSLFGRRGQKLRPAFRAEQLFPGRHPQRRGQIMPIGAAVAGQTGVHEPQAVEQLGPCLLYTSRCV